MTRRFRNLLVLSPFLFNLSAQSSMFSAGPDSLHSGAGVFLHGRILARCVEVSRTFYVELARCQQAGSGLRSSLASDGGFSFEALTPGCYQLTVLTLVHRDRIRGEMVNVDRSSDEIVIDLHNDMAERPNAGFVSMQQLLKPPPRKARQAYEKAVQTASKGHTDSAIALYSRAIEMFPDYASAHEGLALELEHVDRPSEAVAEWSTARRLGIESPQLYSGLSLSLVQLHRYAEAESAARQALAKDPSFALAHYLLAFALVLEGKSSAEALIHFSRAADRIPKALLMSARLRARGGDFEGARRELGQYVEVCSADERPAAKRWLNEMQSLSGLQPGSK